MCAHATKNVQSDNYGKCACNSQFSRSNITFMNKGNTTHTLMRLPISVGMDEVSELRHNWKLATILSSCEVRQCYKIRKANKGVRIRLNCVD